MNYTNANVRRQDRLLNEQSARELLMKGEYGVLSMLNETGGVYSVPVNYVWDGERSLYFHCAVEGRKLRCIDNNNVVSFCVVGRTKVIAEKFSTEYESIVLECKAFRNLPEEEKMKAFRLILEKYTPDETVKGMQYAKDAFSKTEIVRLDIENWSGKTKLLK